MRPRVAVLDLYCAHPNQGMRCIGEIVDRAGLEHRVWEVRQEAALPRLDDFEILISSGGPGDPHEVLTHDWGPAYRSFLDALATSGKPAFLVCHSFQMACLHWGLAEVLPRHRSAFGIYDVFKSSSGDAEQLLEGLGSSFAVVDSRDWQVVQPHPEPMTKLGAEVLVIEKERPHIPLERAAMMMRFTSSIVGTQFHPEADEASLRYYLDNPERLQSMLKSVGEEKVEKIQARLGDPEGIQRTHAWLLPEFLRKSLAEVA